MPTLIYILPRGPGPIRDQYTSLEQVQAALRQAGLESSNLILGLCVCLCVRVTSYWGYQQATYWSHMLKYKTLSATSGIDFTKSNTWTGERSFGISPHLSLWQECRWKHSAQNSSCLAGKIHHRGTQDHDDDNCSHGRRAMPA